MVQDGASDVIFFQHILYLSIYDVTQHTSSSLMYLDLFLGSLQNVYNQFKKGGELKTKNFEQYEKMVM